MKRRLVLVFGSVDFPLEANDILVYNQKGGLPQDITSVCINDARLNRQEWAQRYDEFLASNLIEGADDYNAVIAGCNKNLSRSHHYIFNWIITLENLMEEHEVTTVLITDLVNSFGFAPYYEAEGEVNKEFFYKRYDFIPALIKRYLETRAGIEVKVLRHHSKVWQWFRRLLRRYFLLFAKCFFYLRALGSLKKKTATYAELEEGDILVLNTRTPAHHKAFDLIERKYSNTIFFCAELTSSLGTNYQYAIEKGSRAVSFGTYISHFDLIRIMFKCLRFIWLSNVKHPYFEYLGVKVAYYDSYKEMVIAFFEVWVYQTSLDRFMNELNQKYPGRLKLSTGEMFTPQAYVTNLVGKKYESDTYQIQTTAMTPLKEPNFVHCDYFLFLGRILADQYQMNNPEKESIGRFIGNIQYSSEDALAEIEVSKHDSVKKIIYFSQPVIDEDIEMEIVETLVGAKENLGYRLFVKMHPRDNINKFLKFSEELEFIDNSMSMSEYLNDASVAVLKNSSIATDILIKGVPIIYCLFSEYMRNTRLDFLDPEYIGTLEKIGELVPTLEDFQALKADFELYKQRYLANNYDSKGVEDFLKNLLSTEPLNGHD
ncbi:hypothetical protein EV198_3240 [Roseivirga ehrenbergii]|uniref:Uncharacterized protein n=1 Tax=Roseivirga ehrenbergii (strain DSM 102268 / JCM 13514 / KCTC 12282 / NCIMB 14502 / KMM 6017) TaxID=279360 RepID=A0A150XBX6_ROSEK|nr:polysialyltransferase family glycosyltransferase [Roseivirga ehrenbergii]KYG76249.1 hypothetical protein MB14_03095 [Roseivirga ehrenbergii]TCL00223.1 hypothetical protein EV198_3240 [Roseivirga ehrenbergii]